MNIGNKIRLLCPLNMIITCLVIVVFWAEYYITMLIDEGWFIQTTERGYLIFDVAE